MVLAPTHERRPTGLRGSGASSAAVGIAPFSQFDLASSIEAREVGGAQSVLRAEMHEPPDHGVASDQPGADPVTVFVGPMPDPGLRRREWVADRRLDRPGVAGQQDLDFAGEPADCDHVVPVPGCVGGADDEYARLPQDHKRVSPLARERIGLDPPPGRGQLREPDPELGRCEFKPALEIDEPAEGFERLGGKTRDRRA